MFTSCYLPDPYLANKVVRDFSHFWRGYLRFGFYIVFIYCLFLVSRQRNSHSHSRHRCSHSRYEQTHSSCSHNHALAEVTLIVFLSGANGFCRLGGEAIAFRHYSLMSFHLRLFRVILFGSRQRKTQPHARHR